MVIEVGENRLDMLKRSAVALAALGMKPAGEMPGGGVVQRAIDEVATTANMQAGEFMDRRAVDQIIDLSVSQSGWYGETSVLTRSQRSGQITTIDMTEPVLEGVPENGGRTVLTTPETAARTYECGKYQGTYALTWEDMREARASGDANFGATFSRLFGKRVGESMCLAALRGDTDAGTATRTARLLGKRDGWLKKARAAANHATTTRGSELSRRAFSAISEGLMPDEYRMSENLRWLYSPRVNAGVTEIYGAQFENGNASDLAVGANVKRIIQTPMGIEPILVPQLPTNLGAATLGIASAGTPDNVSGSTTVIARVNTLLGGAAAGNAGRKVTITSLLTGQSETRTVTWDGTHNLVTTTGKLGQTSVSTTTTDYAIDIADCTPILLTNPRNLVTVVCDQIRRYFRWEQEFERWRIDLYIEMDFLILNPDALAMHDGIFVDPDVFAFGS